MYFLILFIITICKINFRKTLKNKNLHQKVSVFKQSAFSYTAHSIKDIKIKMP